MTPLSPVALVARLARKELREILRDRRTIVTLVLMPVLLYPLLTIAFQNYFLTTIAPVAPATQFRIATTSLAEAGRFNDLLKLGGADDPDQPPEFVFFESTDLEDVVRTEGVELGVRHRPATDPEWEILVRADSPLGKRAFAAVQTRLAAANIRLLRQRLRARGDPAPLMIRFDATELTAAADGKKSSLLSSLVPLILVLMTITGAVYPAIDLTAGERERGTLEVLIAAPIPRVGVLLAKYVAVLTVAMLTGLVNLTMMTLTVLVSGLGKHVFETGLSVGLVASMFGLLLLFAMFFSAVLLAVTSFARSFKEAQAYLIPLMLLALAPGMLSLMDIKLAGAVKIVPLLNVVLLAREIFKGDVPLADAVVVIGSTLGYAALAIVVASRIFGAEAVLYSEQGQVADLFRRPREPRAVSTLTAALFCLAILFPANFLIAGGAAQLGNVGIEIRLALSLVASLAMFLGIPALSAWMSRVVPRTGFALTPPPVLALPGALLLGLSLWPLVAELTVLFQSLGVSTLPAAFKDKIQEMLLQWRTVPLLVLLAMALVPAVVEEIFFRGYLFNALLDKMRPWKAVLTSAALFAVFHLLVTDSLAIERLPPSLLMGLVLGVVRWRTGSVFPGVVLHAAHNGFLISANLFPVAFGALSSVSAFDGHVPALWLAGSLAGSFGGGALVWWSGRPRSALP